MRITESLLVVGVAFSMGTTLSHAQGSLALVKSGSAATSDEIVQGTADYNLDVVFNTGGNNVSGIQFWIETSPPGAVTYSSLTPVLVLSNPFVDADLGLTPTGGAIVSQNTKTSFFKQNPPSSAYPAFSANAIARIRVNTGILGAGQFVFTPVGEEITTETQSITTFAPPRPFTLNIVAVPEPSTAVLGMLGTALLLLSRLRRKAD